MTNKVSLENNEATSTFYNNLMLNVFFPSIAIFIMFKNIVNQNKRRTLITNISKYSFGIYLVHDIFLKIVNCNYSPINTMCYPAAVSVPCNALIVLSLSYITVYVLGKIPIIKKYAL